MILSFSGPYDSTINLHRSGELQGIEFIQPPIEYRFLREGAPISAWTLLAGGYVSLLFPVVVGLTVQTRGLDAHHLALETRGLCGTFILLVWPRS